MAVPEEDLPRNIPSAGAAPLRPLPAGAGNYPGQANRPIPLAAKGRGKLVEADDEPEDEEDQDEATLREVIRNAPAWLVSTVFHMLLLIIMGLLAVGAAVKAKKFEVELSNTIDGDGGVQLDDPSVLESAGIDPLGGGDEAILTPKDLPPVDDPLVAPPTLSDMTIAAPLTTQPGAAPIGATGAESAPGIGLALSGRRAGSKAGLLGKYGGTRGTEDAVERGLAWLAKQQRKDGSWSLSGPYSDGARSENVAAATAMALLAFQGHGDTHREGRYSKVVAKGWNALLKMQKKDGSFSLGQMTEVTQLLYTHAQCTIAICELLGMTNDSAYRGPAQRAVAYAVAVQDPDRGGWRYQPRYDSDTSVTGWFVMALQSARMANLDVPDDTLAKVMSFLDSEALDDGRRYGYWKLGNPTSAVAAEGLLCRQYLGWQRDDPRLVEGAELLLKEPVSYKNDNGLPDVYYWYYATQVTHHMEGAVWEQWNAAMRKELPEHQIKSGDEAGSWDPMQDKWGMTAGRLFVTCLSIYNLEVYYRHLPIYSGYSAIKNLPAVPPAATSDDKSGDAVKDEAEPNDSKTDESDPENMDPIESPAPSGSRGSKTKKAPATPAPRLPVPLPGAPEPGNNKSALLDRRP